MSRVSEFRRINRQLNWDVPKESPRCTQCDVFGEPTAGSYSSSLANFEESLGPAPYSATRLRLLVLFQDPRPTNRFEVADPDVPPSDLEAGVHRYFCLTRTAWDVLRLDTHTQSADPRWPQEDDAHHFLRRYFGGTAQWAYDGFLTYFIYRLEPEDALITNVAKCHFEKGSPAQWARRCVPQWLDREAAALRPNLILSFSKAALDALQATGSQLSDLPAVRVYHPGYPCSREARADKLLDELHKQRSTLEQHGVAFERLLETLEEDINRIDRFWSG